MKTALAALALIWVAFASSVQAQTNPVVVELYTSQGCSSCPPADAILHDLAERDDVIALALHVDYWDYIGWKDAFADPAHTARQKAYAVEAGRRSVYTPQMIVGGVDSVVGARAMELSKYIADHAAAPDRVRLSLARQGETLVIRAEMVGAAARAPMVVQLVHFTPERSVKITRGENAGRDMTYANVAHGLKIVAEWTGEEPLEMTTPIAHADPLAVLVQAQNHGPILAAAKLD